MAVNEHTGATPAAIAAHIADALRAAIAARGQASLAVSGGKSPIPMFEALREQDLDWAKVTVVLVDERVVPRDHEASNTALVAQHLLQGRAAQARFLPFFRELATVFNAEVLDALVRDASERIAPCPGRWTWPCSAWARTRTPPRSSPVRRVMPAPSPPTIAWPGWCPNRRPSRHRTRA